VIIVVAGLLAVLTVPLSGGDLRRLGALPIRHAWAIWATLIGQISLAWVPAGDLAGWLHVATYAVAGWFAWANRRLPGVPLMALGGALNLAAIVANDGVMPASPSAWERAGLEPPAPGEEFTNSAPVEDARLGVLGDVFAIPEGWPFANVFSIGDVLIVVGLGWLAHAWCRRPHSAAVADLPEDEAVRRRDLPGG
jgi:hypothetical protein